MEFERSSVNEPWRFKLLFSVIVLNICLPSLVLSYGTLLIHASVSHGEPPWSALITPAVFVFVFCLSQCWCRDAADSWGGDTGYRVMGVVGVLLVFVGVLASAFTSFSLHPLLYGVFGGLGTSITSAQVDAVIFETYGTKISIVRGLCIAGQAIGQFMFPHILTLIVERYGLPMTYLLLSGIMLQSLPAILFLRAKSEIKRPISYSRYNDASKTYAIFSNEAATTSLSHEMPLNDLGSKSWKSPSDDNLHCELDINFHYDDSDDDDDDNPIITPPPSPEEKRRNIFGVDILPEIPEETEGSSDDSDDDDIKNKNRLSAAIKRLSLLSNNLDGYISKEIRKDSVNEIDISNNEYSEIEVIYDNVSPVTEITHEKVFNSFSFRCQSLYFDMKRKVQVPSYKVYRVKRRCLYFLYSLNDTFIKPLTRSLSCWRFYPALLLCFVKCSLTAISLPLLPLISFQIRPKISLTEMNFLMSLHAFTWICFLLGTPWIASTSKKNLKYIVVLGLIISTIALFLVSESNSHDSFSVGCVVAGLGFGAITCCWENTVQQFVGPRKYPKIQSTLETLSGIVLAVFVMCVWFFSPRWNDIQMWFVLLGGVVGTVTGVWLVIAIVLFIKSTIKKVNLRRRWNS